MFELILRSQLFLILIIALNVALIIYLLIKEKINVEYSLIWFFALIFAAIIVVSKKFLLFLTSLIGAKLPASTLAYLGFTFIFFVLIYFSTRISILSNKLKKLIQYTAFLEKKQKELEKRKNNQSTPIKNKDL
ncbi:MAG TPA: DUF2304 domain-containing protein [Acidobacteriota bacterium]|nr:DUF2304 domain-containing protein [Acidobacteriota bacterium]